MFEILLDFLQKKNINCVGMLPLSACRVLRPYLLERANIASGTVFMLAIPYFTPACEDAQRSVSAYAVSRDYHLFFEELYNELLPYLKKQFPTAKFAAFADHSPIHEVHAAACAGLGIIGKNGLFITEPYGSYVFLGEIITDMEIPCTLHSPRFCEACGACENACPSMVSEKSACLSALSQKKGICIKKSLKCCAIPKRFGAVTDVRNAVPTISAPKQQVRSIPPSLFSTKTYSHAQLLSK